MARGTEVAHRPFYPLYNILKDNKSASLPQIFFKISMSQASVTYSMQCFVSANCEDVA